MAQHRFSSAGRHSSSSEYRLDAPAIAFSGVRRESFRGKAPRNMIWSLLEAVLAPFSGRNKPGLGRPNTKSLLLLFNTTRMVPGPPSTGVAIAMDGGMADTACYYTGR